MESKNLKALLWWKGSRICFQNARASCVSFALSHAPCRKEAVGGLFFLSNSQGCRRHHATAPNSIPEPIAPIESICCATNDGGLVKTPIACFLTSVTKASNSVCLTPYPYVVSIGLRASSFKPNFRLDRELATFNSRLSKFGGFATLRDGKQSNRANS